LAISLRKMRPLPLVTLLFALAENPHCRIEASSRGLFLSFSSLPFFCRY
jgi:hypothetical protein